MNANELAKELAKITGYSVEHEYQHELIVEAEAMILQQQEKLTKYELRHAEQRKRIDELEAYQKHDVELAEAVGWDKGYEAGRQLGMKQERALWELAASTQEIMDTHPVKELTDEEIMDELVKVKHTWVATTSVWYEFEKEELKKAIREILRKAQE